MIKKPLLLLLVILLTLGTSACSTIDRSEQPASTSFVTLSSGDHMGQTFVATYDGLQGGMLLLKPSESGGSSTGNIRFHLRSGPLDTRDLQTAALPLKNIKEPGIYRFQFSPLPGSARQDYYLEVELDGPGSVEISTAPGDAYLNGALYQDSEAQEAQLTFGLAYKVTPLAAGLLGEGLFWLWMLIAGALLFIIPGWALLGSLWPGWKALHWAEKLALSGGVSAAVYPLLFLWTDLIGLHLGPLYAWLPPLIGLGVIIGQNILAWKKSNPTGLRSAAPRGSNLGQLARPLHSLAGRALSKLSRTEPAAAAEVALVIAIGLIIATRFWVIRQLDLPLWGDSYQHTVMAQLLVDNNGLFDSWHPYADMTTFTYHYGFHAHAAVLHWVTGLSLPQSILWTGQILNFLAVITLIPLAMRLHRSPWSALGAILLAGLLSPMPMFYVNWGRYTQLAGQVILPVAVYLAWHNLDADKPLNWRQSVPVWIALGGLALAHYRVLIFAVLFFLAHFLLNLGRKPILTQVTRIAWSGIGAALLFLPWFIHVFGGQIMAIVAGQLSAPAGQGSDFSAAVGNIQNYLPGVIWLSLPFLISWGLWRRERSVSIISLWWFILFLAVNPQWFGLSGAGTIGNFTLLIAAYILASLLVGGAVGWTIQALQVKSRSTHLRKTLPLALAVFFCLAALWGARQRLGDIQTANHALAVRPDLRAATWIEQNVPGETRFLVNSFSAYGGSSVAGSDGGWWLPIIAHRSTTLPPLTYVAEQGPRPNYREWVNSLTAEIQAKGIDHPDVIHMLQERGVTHVYIGQRQGTINSGGFALDIDQLLSSPHYQMIYHQDRVWIFKFSP